MEARIIQHNNISRLELRTETFFDPSIEDVYIGTSFKSHRCKNFHSSLMSTSSRSSNKCRLFISVSILFWRNRFSYRRPTSTFDLIVIYSTLIDIDDCSYFYYILNLLPLLWMYLCILHSFLCTSPLFFITVVHVFEAFPYCYFRDEKIVSNILESIIDMCISIMLEVFIRELFLLSILSSLIF